MSDDQPTLQTPHQTQCYVLQAYRFNANDDLLEKLMTLSIELSEKEKQGEPVIGPWNPTQ